MLDAYKNAGGCGDGPGWQEPTSRKMRASGGGGGACTNTIKNRVLNHVGLQCEKLPPSPTVAGKPPRLV